MEFEPSSWWYHFVPLYFVSLLSSHYMRTKGPERPQRTGYIPQFVINQLAPCENLLAAIFIHIIAGKPGKLSRKWAYLSILCHSDHEKRAIKVVTTKFWYFPPKRKNIWKKRSFSSVITQLQTNVTDCKENFDNIITHIEDRRSCGYFILIQSHALCGRLLTWTHEHSEVYTV